MITKHKDDAAAYKWFAGHTVSQGEEQAARIEQEKWRVTLLQMVSSDSSAFLFLI